MQMNYKNIKFKFWLGHTKKMTYPHSIDDISNVIPSFTDDIIPLQFTGHKDIFGREIYEGDILKYLDYTSISTKIHAVKRFPSGAFLLDCTMKREIFKIPVVAVASLCERIGNIYEDPNMLPEQIIS